jgi:hypothetical protein
MTTDAGLLLGLTIAYVVATAYGYVRTRRRLATLGDTLLANLIKHKVQTRTAS